MPLKVLKMTNFNIWERLFCPVCRGRKFKSYQHTAVYCHFCNARFEIRPTGGDHGYVADCFTDDCTPIKFFGGGSIDYRKVADERVPLGHCYWVDKEYDYCSGWIYFDRSGRVQVDPMLPASQVPENK